MRAVLQAYAEGRIELSPVPKQTHTNQIRYVDDVSRDRASSERSKPYTADKGRNTYSLPTECHQPSLPLLVAEQSTSVSPTVLESASCLPPNSASVPPRDRP